MREECESMVIRAGMSDWHSHRAARTCGHLRRERVSIGDDSGTARECQSDRAARMRPAAGRSGSTCSGEALLPFVFERREPQRDHRICTASPPAHPASSLQSPIDNDIHPFLAAAGRLPDRLPCRIVRYPLTLAHETLGERRQCTVRIAPLHRCYDPHPLSPYLPRPPPRTPSA